MAKRGAKIAVHVSDFMLDTWQMSAREVGEFLLSILHAAKDRRWDEISHPFKVINRGTNRPSISRTDRAYVLSAGRCAKCGSTEHLTVDHIVPLARGGDHDRSNFQCLCFPCNRHKSDRLEEELA